MFLMNKLITKQFLQKFVAHLFKVALKVTMVISLINMNNLLLKFAFLRMVKPHQEKLLQ